MALTGTVLPTILGIEATGALAVVLGLVEFRREYDRVWLRWWCASWACLAGFLALVGGESFVRSEPSLRAVHVAMIVMAGLLGLAQLGWLLAGAWRFTRRSPLDPVLARRGAIAAIAACCLVALVALALVRDDAVRRIVLLSAHSILAAVSLVVSGWMTWRFRVRGARVSYAIFVLALMMLAGCEAIGAGLLAAAGGGAGSDVAIAGIVLAVIEVVVSCLVALGILIAALEDDREAAVRAIYRAEQTAMHDPLSGLPNRALFFDRLERSIEHASRHQHRLAVLYLDLDRFKLINDSLGHTTGDTLIRLASERLESCIRREDTLARVGGDEFVVLLPIIGRTEDAGLIAEKIVNALGSPFTIGGREIVVTSSVGIAMFPSDATDADGLVHAADTAMYWAKESGRDRVRYFAPAMNSHALEILELETDLRRAVMKDELTLHYQPLIDIVGGKIFGLEALLRWNHPRCGLVMPDRFIPTAESTGLIIPIGNWVLKEACRQAKNWQKQLGTDLVVAVNLSPKQFDQPDLTGKVCEALADSGLHPSFLELEITETHAMLDIEKTIRVMRQLRGLGVRLSIDDFGTGYSSLSYLKRMPIDTLKLDQSFVREITAPEDGAIARGVIAMAHSLKLRVLAEGVETLGQLEFLRDHECDRLQGFLFSRPLDAAMISSFVQRQGLIVQTRAHAAEC